MKKILEKHMNLMSNRKNLNSTPESDETETETRDNNNGMYLIKNILQINI